MLSRTSFFTTVLAALSAAVLLGCGEKADRLSPASTQAQITLALDWFPNPDHAGIYTGISKGRFKEVGLKVSAKPPSDPSLPIKNVAADRVDLAISYEPEVLIARERGLPVVAVAAIVKRPLTSLAALRSKKIRNGKDLEGKRVGTAGIPYQSAYLKTILKKAGVDPASVKETNIGSNLLPALLSKKVDAVLGIFWNVEGIQLKLRKRPSVVTPVDRLGIPSYDELVLVANENVVKSNPSWLRRFIAAMSRGTRDAKRNPKMAMRALRRANRDLDPDLVRASVKATIPTLFPRDAKRPIGYMDPLKWESYGAWMAENDLINRRPDISKAVTNRFLSD